MDAKCDGTFQEILAASSIEIHFTSVVFAEKNCCSSDMRSVSVSDEAGNVFKISLLLLKTKAVFM